MRALRANMHRAEDARIVASLASLIAAAVLIVAAAVYLGSVRQDTLQHVNEERVVTQSVRSLQRTLTATVRDYAWWNEAVRHLLLELDEDWADINIGPYVYSNLGYEVALVVDKADRPVIGWLREAREPAAASAALGPSLPLLLAEARRRQQGPDPVAVSGILAANEELLVVAASPIVPQLGSEEIMPAGPPAMMVFAKRLDDAFLSGISSDFGLNALDFASPEAKLGQNVARVPLEGPNAGIVGQIVWEPWHPGRTQRAWLMPTLLASLVVFTLFTRIVLASIRRATFVMRQSEARFRDIAEAASDWIWETDRDLVLSYVSDSFVDATGLSPTAVLGQPLNRVIEPADAKLHQQHASDLTAARAFRNIVCVLRLRGGEDTRTLRLAGKPVHDGTGRFRGYRGTATDISSETAALRQVQFLARHDPLTRLPNRAAFQEHLDDLVQHLDGQREQAAVLCIDLDRFKEINDSMGHAAGDRVLVDSAKRLLECVRDTDLVARLGGDEFAVVVTGIAEPGDVQSLCDRILRSLADPIRIDGTEAVVGASIGVAVVPVDGRDTARILQNSDIALYRAKYDGRNRACFFQAGMAQGLRERRALETALRHALSAGELAVHYQPMVSLDSTSMIGVEALLRWHSPTRGTVAPADFIPVAEESGMIIGIGDWVLQTACREAARWPGLTLSVNVSPAQFRQRDLVGTVEQAVAKAQIRADQLELEITEGVLIANTADALRTLRQLKDIGVRIAMDDFGTGYSSLSYLQKFPLDKIKIDRSFIANLCEDNSAIVRAIIGLGQSLGMQVCAEGVETAEQASLLRREGCKQAQGYLFGHAMAPTLIDELLGNGGYNRGRRLRVVG